MAKPLWRSSAVQSNQEIRGTLRLASINVLTFALATMSLSWGADGDNIHPLSCCDHNRPYRFR